MNIQEAALFYINIKKEIISEGMFLLYSASCIIIHHFILYHLNIDNTGNSDRHCPEYNTTKICFQIQDNEYIFKWSE